MFGTDLLILHTLYIMFLFLTTFPLAASPAPSFRSARCDVSNILGNFFTLGKIFGVLVMISNFFKYNITS